MALECLFEWLLNGKTVQEEEVPTDNETSHDY